MKKKKMILYGYIKIGPIKWLIVTGKTAPHTRQEEGKKDAYIDRTDYSDPIMPVLCIHVCGGERDAAPSAPAILQISGPFSLLSLPFWPRTEKRGGGIVGWGGLRPGAGWRRIHTQDKKKYPALWAALQLIERENGRRKKNHQISFELVRDWAQVKPVRLSPEWESLIRPNHLPFALAITKFDQVNRWWSNLEHPLFLLFLFSARPSNFYVCFVVFFLFG